MTEKAVEKRDRGDIHRRQAHKLTGIVLAVIGFFWLAKKAGWIPVAAGGSGIFWPVITIALAAMVFFIGRHRRKGN